MVKKILLCLVLVVALMLGGIDGVYAGENGQECTLLGGQQIIQVMPDSSMRAITTPEEAIITLGPELSEEIIANLNPQTNKDWTGGHIAMIVVDFGHGPVPVMIVVRLENIKDCK